MVSRYEKLPILLASDRIPMFLYASFQETEHDPSYIAFDD
jgi:hypothetical protein